MNKNRQFLVVLLILQQARSGVFYAGCMVICYAGCALISGGNPLTLEICTEGCSIPCTGACFEQNTLITTDLEENISKPIHLIEPDQVIQTLDPTTFKTIFTKVIANKLHEGAFDALSIQAKNFSTEETKNVTVTNEHILAIRNGTNNVLIRAEQLFIGAILIGSQNQSLVVTRIQSVTIY